VEWSALSAPGELILTNAVNTSMNEPEEEDDDLLPHYDFDYSQAQPNRFAERFSKTITKVGLEPDVASEFPTEQSVNDALRAYLKITRGENPEIRPR
jgi:hypothetical protein